MKRTNEVSAHVQGLIYIGGIWKTQDTVTWVQDLQSLSQVCSNCPCHRNWVFIQHYLHPLSVHDFISYRLLRPSYKTSEFPSRLQDSWIGSSTQRFNNRVNYLSDLYIANCSPCLVISKDPMSKLHVLAPSTHATPDPRSSNKLCSLTQPTALSTSDVISCSSH